MARTKQPKSEYLRALTYPAPRTAGAHIRLLQTELIASKHDPGPVDGIYGPLTRAALSAYIAERLPKPEPIAPGQLALRLLREAHMDWEAGTSESDQSTEGRLSAIFRDSGWSLRTDVSRRTGRVKDWCGMSVAAWADRCGFAPALRSAMYQTNNVRSFFSYRRAGPVHHRTDMVAIVAGVERPLEELHRQRGALRAWIETDKLHGLPLDKWTIAPGAVLLINHHGRRDKAHHITLVESFDGRTLVTMEGNASGQSGGGKRISQAVVRVTRDLTDPAVRATIFGHGKFSSVDFDATVSYP